MTAPLVLSLFPGADLFGRAFELAGCCVVRGPDRLLGQDIGDWPRPPIGAFDGIIATPPCQIHSTAWRIGGRPGRHGDWVPFSFDFIEHHKPTWAVVENVPQVLKLHPPRVGWGVVKLRDWDCGGLTNRTRVFYLWPRELADGVPTPQRRPGRPSLSVLASSYRVGKRGHGRMLCGLNPEEAARLQGWPEIVATLQSEAHAGKKGNRLIGRALMVHYMGNGVPRALGEWVARHVLAASRSEMVLLT